MARNCSHRSWRRESGGGRPHARPPPSPGARYAWNGAGGSGAGAGTGRGSCREDEGAMKKREKAASGSHATPGRRRALVTAVMVVSGMPCHGARVYVCATWEPLSRATLCMRD